MVKPMAVVKPNRQEQRRETSTRALLDAAGELVLEGGFRAMTFAAIGKRAGFSPAMVTARFGSRQGLIEELLDRILEPWMDRNREAITSAGPGLAKLGALLDAVVDRIESDPTGSRILNALRFEAIGGEPLLAEHVRAQHGETVDAFRRAFEAGQADGSITAEVDPEVEAQALMSQLRGISYQWLLDGERFEPIAALGHLKLVLFERLDPEV
ncbi:MAG: TetR/AcrR family transcriptional regulator [Actinomycetota bacterium]